jgi:NAD-dependent dihydropyrimidine dehydrogenase PreA subunit
MTYVITEPCQKDGNCLAVCPVDCIYTTDDDPQYYINPDECIDCGACVADCPEQGIFAAADLPAEKAHYEQSNAGYFSTR